MNYSKEFHSRLHFRRKIISYTILWYMDIDFMLHNNITGQKENIEYWVQSVRLLAIFTKIVSEVSIKMFPSNEPTVQANSQLSWVLEGFTFNIVVVISLPFNCSTFYHASNSGWLIRMRCDEIEWIIFGGWIDRGWSVGWLQYTSLYWEGFRWHYNL